MQGAKYGCSTVSNEVVGGFGGFLVKGALGDRENLERGRIQADQVAHSGRHARASDTGDGIDMEHAVVIHARNWRKGLADQYAYISGLHGLRSRDWYIESQEILHAGDRSYEIFVIRTSDGARLRYYFDVTSFRR